MKLSKTLLACAFAAAILTASAADKQLVAVTQIVQHPALDAAFKGLKEALAAEGFKDGENITIEYEIAQGDPALATQIAQKFTGEHPAVMVGISTPSAQALKAASHGQIPVVFAAVTDPVAADLVADKQKPGGMVTGSSDAVPLAKGVAMMQSILPNVKTIGTVYNPGEANSEAAVKELEAACKDAGLTLLSAPATKTSEVLDAARSLVGKADAIYITLDNTAVSSLASIIRVGEQSKIPVFTVDTSSVAAEGSIAAIGFSYEDVGRNAGKQAAAVLKGEKAGDIPVAEISRLELYINPEAAKKMGVTIPQAVLDSAAHTVTTQK